MQQKTRDSKDTKADTHRVRDQPCSFHGPYRAPEIDGPGHYNFQAYFMVSLPFLYCTLSSPSNHFGTLFWSLWNSIRAQGTLLDLHWPQNGPQNGPCEAYFRGPLIEKGPPGSLHGPHWPIRIEHVGLIADGKCRENRPSEMFSSDWNSIWQCVCVIGTGGDQSNFCK